MKCSLCHRILKTKELFLIVFRDFSFPIKLDYF